jgi:putative membrane protein
MKYKIFLLVIFLLLWIWGAIHPYNREDWMLENILVYIFVPFVIAVGSYFRMSNFSYTLIAIYMMLHIIGTHFTYGQVPLGFTLEHILGTTRNMYDRIMHFSFGFLIAFPVREAFMKVAKAKGFWSFFLPIELVFAWSALYEIMEWLVARSVSPDAAFAFLGSQGDIWDTQKDMLVAGCGAIIAMFIAFVFIRLRVNRNVMHEIKQSLSVSEPALSIEREVPVALSDDRLKA